MEMFFYGVDSSFWLKFFLFLFVLWLVMFLFSRIVRRILRVEKKKMFSYNHLNEKHKKIDWTIRFAFIVVMIVGAIINSTRFPLNPILFLETYFVLMMLVFSTEIVTAVMEWKYAENRNAYIFTVLQLLFIAILFLSMFLTNFFGLFG